MSGRQRQILHIALPVPLRRHFDYLPADDSVKNLLPGTRVNVPFGKSLSKTGILMKISGESEFEENRLKKIREVLDEQPLFTSHHLDFLYWASDYYHHPIGEVLFNALPPLLRRGKPAKRKTEYLWQLTDAGKNISTSKLKQAPNQARLIDFLQSHQQGISHEQLKARASSPSVIKALEKKGYITKLEKQGTHEHISLPESGTHLNTAQENAADAIRTSIGRYQPFLLHGVTGSGKTEVYIEIAKAIIREGLQAIILVPEIGLTPQLIDRFSEQIKSQPAVLHSGLSEKERLQAWLQARDGIAPVILGTRSAIWIPLSKPGIIIVDEEHDPSYKQQEGFRYSARDVAIMRAKMENIPVVLGSATPSMESLHNADNGKYIKLRLSERAGQAKPPLVNVIDVRARQMYGALSQPLIDAIAEQLNNKNQVLMFLNKRGFSPVLMCHACGWIAKCSRCNIQMTYHKYFGKLSCHHCGKQIPLVQNCPECNESDLLQIGHGTERLAETLSEIFPAAKIVRIDRDSTRRKGSMQEMLDSIQTGEADILIGTQMLAKGHHFPHLTLVGIIDADRGIFSSDFRASERMAQLFVQVSGRAGRVNNQGMVLIQTHYPFHPLIRSLVTGGYSEFSKILMDEREQTKLPPFSFFVLLRAEDYKISSVMEFLTRANELLEAKSGKIISFGPMPAPIEKRAGRYRFQLLIQGENRNILKQHITPWGRLLETLPNARKIRWSLDVDPQEML